MEKYIKEIVKIFTGYEEKSELINVFLKKIKWLNENDSQARQSINFRFLKIAIEDEYTDEQILRIQNYNKTVYQNNMKPFLKEKEKLQTLNKEHMKTKKKKLLKKSSPNKVKKEK